MIVPQFWAEAKGECSLAGRRITIKRFGWSDRDIEDATVKAEVRLTDAITAMESGEKLKRVDPKTAYNGADGMPIREEIISRHDDVVITRNGYGARCLNTPDVLFADIDFADVVPIGSSVLPRFLLLLSLAIVAGVLAQVWVGVVLFAVGFFWLHRLDRRQSATKRALIESQEEVAAHARIHTFVEQHPDWHLRIYRTPMGLRVLVMHRLFDPREEVVQSFFKTLHVDPLYQTMCYNQGCFRARVSPKPWRIEIWEHIEPGRGVWPVKDEFVLQRDAWVKEYEACAKDYAACRFIKSLGHHLADPKALRIQQLHDQLSQANYTLPIA